MKKLPVEISSFRKIREQWCAYVDKSRFTSPVQHIRIPVVQADGQPLAGTGPIFFRQIRVTS